MMTSLFHSLARLTPLPSLPHLHRALGPPQPTSALHRLSATDAQHARSVFLTLQVLFPHELLPALDILDRGLVTRLVVKQDEHTQAPNPIAGTTGMGKGSAPSDVEVDDEGVLEDVNGWEVYYVQSSSAVTSRSGKSRTTGSSRYSTRRHDPSATFYEVRLASWNCSCPAFSVSAFQGLNVQAEESAATIDAMDADLGWRFGGVATNPSTRSVPSCKHILAAVLAKAAPKLFGPGVHVNRVSKEELAGWGAGWGELGVG